MNLDSIIKVNWDAPANIKAYSTTRLGGVSEGIYASLNLGAHVNDSIERVTQNRQQLATILDLPSTPLWLNQIHSTRAIQFSNQLENKDADACISNKKNEVCVIMTGDCLPILLCNRAGTEIAAIHAGWRGLQAGVINQTLAKMRTHPNELLVWIGPTISPKHYQLSADIREKFTNKMNEFEAGFHQDSNKNWFGDMFKLAQINLAHCGVKAIHGDPICTYSDPTRFFSYRRDGTTGRMATLIYIS